MAETAAEHLQVHRLDSETLNTLAGLGASPALVKQLDDAPFVSPQADAPGGTTQHYDLHNCIAHLV